MSKKQAVKFAIHKEKNIAYQVEGKGPALVFLHGFCEDSGIWEDFKPDFIEENFKVITIDLPGFGQSDLLPENAIEDMAEAVATVIDKLNLPPFILIGHSMGGYVSLAFAEKYPNLLIGLGLFHSHPYADSEAKKEGRQKGINFIKEHGHVLFVKQLFPNLFTRKYARSNSFLIDKLTYQASNYQSESIISALEAMKNRPDRSMVLTQFSAPVLFIVGKEDTAVPADKSLEQTHLPQVASIHILEKVGHMGMFEAKKQTQLLIRQFAQFCLKTSTK